MESNKADLISALGAWEAKLSEHEFLAGSALSLADMVAVADVRPAFEKVRLASAPERAEC